MEKNYFTFNELLDSKIAERHNIINIPNSAVVWDNMTCLITNVLNPLRQAVGKPIKVNSGYRCSELNALVGGVETSQHLRGEAADVTWHDYQSSRGNIYNMLMSLPFGFDQAIVYSTFLHISNKRIGTNRKLIIFKCSR